MGGKGGSLLKIEAICYGAENGTDLEQQIRKKYSEMRWAMDERIKRVWAASEAKALGRGGVTVVAQATGLSRQTIQAGRKEILQREGAPTESSAAAESQTARKDRLRRAGGGRKSLIQQQPGLREALEKLVDPTTRGDPSSPLRWTCKSLRKLSAELKQQGFSISYTTTGILLEDLDYSLQANRKTHEGSSHPDRNAQFLRIAERSRQFLENGKPVISVDAKKKENVGHYKNGGREWEPQGTPELVNGHDFAKKKAVIYGTYDPGKNCGWVSVGIDHDTAEFAVGTIRSWWKHLGQSLYPGASELLITADAGGSNGYRLRLWKRALQQFANESTLSLVICHFPPGTSKWNKIEHRMFSHITGNWRGKPLTSYEVIVNLIAATTTTKGLYIRAALDDNHYPKGIKVPDKEMAQINLDRDDFHGEWNYTIRPNLENR